MSCEPVEQPPSPDDLELLRRHVPLLQYSQEPYRICSARTIVDTPGNALVRADGTRVEAGGGLSLDDLAPDADEGEYLDEETPDDIELQPPALQHDPGYANRVYGRVVDGREGTWLQYWFWIYYNQKRLGGVGSHEGDWEMIQIHLRPGEMPDRVTFAQHERQEARDWKPGETVEVRKASDGRDRLVVFVAPFSHASYFSAGTVFYAGGTDSPDRLGPCELPEIEPFGGWAHWPGRWGGSGTEGKRHSPRSPACQGGDKWRDPEAFHESPAKVKLTHWMVRKVWLVGKRTFPLAPEVVAAIEDDHVHVRYVTPTIVRRGSHLYVSAHDPETRQLVARPVVERRRRAKGDVRLPLHRDVDGCVVHATAYNFLRQTSYPGTTYAVRGGAR